jgi:mRNA-degrading endonuclease toxin of MazEF toxin-antitoxin module
MKVFKKDYKDWMPVKASIHNVGFRPQHYKAGEIWICSIGDNIGYENDGKGIGFNRPVLIISGINKFTCVIVPLSTTSKRTEYHYPFDGSTGKTSVALIRQIRVIDTSRLTRQFGKASHADMIKIKGLIKKLLEL